MPHLPCENPDCKSYGKPHPNCRCHGQYAGGGSVKECFGKHDPDCEYFAGGGDTIDPSKVVLDQPAAAQSEIDPSKVEVDPEIDPSKVEVDPEIDPSAVKLDNRYDTAEQQLKTGLEGAAQGLAGPLATWAELKMGVNPEDIKGRAATNPGIHGTSEAGALVGSLLTGYGEAALAERAAAALVPKSLPMLGSIGSAAIKGAIQMGLYQGGDEITKSLLAAPGSDPQAAVSSALVNIRNSVLMGAATGGVFGAVAKGVSNALEGSKIGAKLNSFVAGIGAEHSASEIPGEIRAMPEGALPADFDKGVKFYREGIAKVYGKLSRAATDATAAAIASHYGGGASVEAADMMDRFLGGYAEKIFNKPLTEATKKYAIPAFLKAISSGASADGAMQAIDYATNISRGAQSISNGIEKIFKPAAQQAYDYFVSEKERQQLEDFIENGGVDQQIQNQSIAEPQPIAFAHGGPVPKHQPGQTDQNHLENIFPAQNALISTTRARISNYLNSVRPLPNPAKAAFDKDPADADKKRTYKKALNIAIKPLSVLKHLHDGTLGIDEMQHANAMYPEVMAHLRDKLSERVVKAQLNKETPSYRSRQGMSLFLGQAVDSCLQPASIAAAQSVFAAKSAQQQMQQNGPPKKGGKKGTTSLSKASDPYMTANQSREARQNKV